MGNEYKKVDLSDLLTDDGYVVAIEGDAELHDEEVGSWLKNNIKRYKLINNIYDHPEKLLELKDIKIDVFVFQTTGFNPKLRELVNFYMKYIKNYPKHFVSLYEGNEGFLIPVFKQMDSYEVYSYKNIIDNKIMLIRQDYLCKV